MARVLIVDDERKLRRAFVLFLRDEGHVIATAASLEEALAVLEQSVSDGQLFDVVVTDTLPEQAGLSLMKSIGKRWPEIELILATEERALESAVSAVRGGAHSYILKPVTSTKLCRAVASAAKAKFARDEVHGSLREKEQLRAELLRRAEAYEEQCMELCRQLSSVSIVRQPSTRAPSERAEEPVKPVAKRILVVDDERTLRRVFSMFLSDEGFEVETADNVDAGLAAIERSYANGTPFVIVVSDILMPGRSGTVIMEEIAARWPEIKLIVVTGEPTIETAVIAVRTGVYEYMYKPVSSWLIRKVVANALAARSAEDEQRRRAGAIDEELVLLEQQVEAQAREVEELSELLAAARD